MPSDRPDLPVPRNSKLSIFSAQKTPYPFHASDDISTVILLALPQSTQYHHTEESYIRRGHRLELDGTRNPGTHLRRRWNEAGTNGIGAVAKSLQSRLHRSGHRLSMHVRGLSASMPYCAEVLAIPTQSPSKTVRCRSHGINTKMRIYLLRSQLTPSKLVASVVLPQKGLPALGSLPWSISLC